MWLQKRIGPPQKTKVHRAKNLTSFKVLIKISMFNILIALLEKWMFNNHLFLLWIVSNKGIIFGEANLQLHFNQCKDPVTGSISQICHHINTVSLWWLSAMCWQKIKTKTSLKIKKVYKIIYTDICIIICK